MTLKKNEVIERKNRVLQEMKRLMLYVKWFSQKLLGRIK